MNGNQWVIASLDLESKCQLKIALPRPWPTNFRAETNFIWLIYSKWFSSGRKIRPNEIWIESKRCGTTTDEISLRLRHCAKLLLLHFIVNQIKIKCKQKLSQQLAPIFPENNFSERETSRSFQIWENYRSENGVFVL